MMGHRATFLWVLLFGLLAGCGGGGGGGSSRNVDQTGSLSVGLTDAPVDDVAELRLYLTGLTVNRAGAGPGETFDVDLTDCVSRPGETDDCNPVNLLALQGGIVLTVLNGQEVAAGDYEWLRLEVDGSRSYVVEGAGGVNEEIDVRVPSARGLQLSGGFAVLAGRTTDLVMDWDARQGLAHSVGTDTYIVKPSIRLTDLAQHGSIVGTVSDTITDGDCPDDGVVYVFEGDVTPDDIDNNDPNPLVTAAVDADASGSFGYEVSFLPSGDTGRDYTVALTCEARSDSVPIDDADPNDGDDAIVFINPQLATVLDGQTEEIDF